MSGTFLIVGGSYAACQMAGPARDAGYDCSIAILTEEEHLPYHRPPLSEAYLDTTAPTQELPLKSEAYCQKERIDVLLNTRVTRLDLSGRSVSFDGRELRFDTLGIATGARPRKLSIPGSDLKVFCTCDRLQMPRSLKKCPERV